MKNETVFLHVWIDRSNKKKHFLFLKPVFILTKHVLDKFHIGCNDFTVLKVDYDEMLKHRNPMMKCLLKPKSMIRGA